MKLKFDWLTALIVSAFWLLVIGIVIGFNLEDDIKGMVRYAINNAKFPITLSSGPNENHIPVGDPIPSPFGNLAIGQVYKNEKGIYSLYVAWQGDFKDQHWINWNSATEIRNVKWTGKWDISYETDTETCTVTNLDKWSKCLTKVP